MAEIADLVAEVTSHGAKLWLAEGKVRFAGSLPPELLERMRARKAELGTWLANRAASPNTTMPLAPLGRARPLPISCEEMFFYDALQSDRTGFPVLRLFFRLQGAWSGTTLADAIRSVVADHEILRTGFVEQDGRVRRLIANADTFTVSMEDARGMDEAQLRRLMAQQAMAASHLTDLASPPLFRAIVLERGGGEIFLILVAHHITYDGQSWAILLEEILAAYAAQTGALPLSAPPRLQYADYAGCQQDWLGGDGGAPVIGYWQRKLQGLPPALDLKTGPADGPLQPRLSASIVIAPDIAAGLAALGERQGATLFIAYLTALNVMLALRSGQGDIVVGSPFLTRDLMDEPRMLGCFVDQLVFRSRIDLDRSFRETLAQVMADTLEAYAHQPLPAAILARRMGLPFDEFNVRAYSMMLVSQAAMPALDSEHARRVMAALPGLDIAVHDDPGLPAAVEALMPEPKDGHCILSMILLELDKDRGICGALTCFRARGPQAQAALEDMVRLLQTLIGAVIAQPDRPLRDLAP